MALTSCRECGQTVSTEAPACPHCGITDPTRTPTAARPAEASTPARRSMTGKQTFFLGVGIFLFIGVIADITADPKPAATTASTEASAEANTTGARKAERAAAKERRQAEARGVEAYVMCQQFVRQGLKAPRTAKFPWGSDPYTTHLGDGRYRVRSYVDAQNSFGAMIRSQYDCTVQWAGGDAWRLEKLAIE